MTVAEWDLILKIALVVLGCIAVLQFRETRKKRHIDMYWKIAEIYAAPTQRNAKYDASVHVNNFLAYNKKRSNPELIEMYDKEYHKRDSGSDSKKIDISVMDRIRFLNQIGILIRKKLIDKDMLFGLIGVGLELDKDALTFVLKAHSISHGIDMYKEFYLVCEEHEAWKNKNKVQNFKK